MREEVEEFLEAGDLVGQVDAIVDLIYFALGALVEMGVDAGPVFDIVHEANMQKTRSPQGLRKRSTDGKVQKPDGWESPERKIAEAIVRGASPYELVPAPAGGSLDACLTMIGNALVSYYGGQ